jgi:hypothetical protein
MSYLNPDRIFDHEPAIRKIARELYESVRGQPIISLNRDDARKITGPWPMI